MKCGIRGWGGLIDCMLTHRRSLLLIYEPGTSFLSYVPERPQHRPQRRRRWSWSRSQISRTVYFSHDDRIRLLTRPERRRRAASTTLDPNKLGHNTTLSGDVMSAEDLVTGTISYAHYSTKHSWPAEVTSPSDLWAAGSYSRWLSGSPILIVYFLAISLSSKPSKTCLQISFRILPTPLLLVLSPCRPTPE